MYGPQAEPGADAAFDPQRVAVPDNLQVDAALMTEFAGAAKELGLSHGKAEKLIALHAKAVQAQDAAADRQAAEWQEATRAHFGHRLDDTVSQIRDRVGSDQDGREFLRLMGASGLGNNVTVLRVLERLARGW